MRLRGVRVKNHQISAVQSTAGGSVRGLVAHQRSEELCSRKAASIGGEDNPRDRGCVPLYVISDVYDPCEGLKLMSISCSYAFSILPSRREQVESLLFPFCARDSEALSSFEQSFSLWDFRTRVLTYSVLQAV